MDVFSHYLAGIKQTDHKARLSEVLEWIATNYPQLEKRVAWNQPMFMHHGTFIIGFSVAKAHLAVAPENVTINRFAAELDEADYSCTREIFRIKWNSSVNYDLLARIIEFNIEDKADCQTFWRK